MRSHSASSVNQAFISVLWKTLISSSSRLPNTFLFPTFPTCRFPKDKLLRRLWTVALRRRHFKPNDYSVICSRHFRTEDFDLTGQTTRLRERVVPSVFAYSKVPAPSVSVRHSLLRERREVLAARVKVQKPLLWLQVSKPRTTKTSQKAAPPAPPPAPADPSSKDKKDLPPVRSATLCHSATPYGRR